MKEQRKTPKLRFPEFTGDWKQRKLGDSCKLNGRIGFRGYTEKDIISKEAGGVLTFSPTNIVDNKLTIECKNTYITREKYDESPEIKISNGDILFVKTGSTLGKSALVTGLKEDASINPQIVVMRVEKDTENFMSNVLITNRVMKQVAAVKIGGAVPTMTETELKNFTYFAPAEKEEKKKIGDYFRTLDHLITLHQRKCDAIKELKKGMLQKMFPKNGEKIPEVRFPGFTDDWEQRKLGDISESYSGGTPTAGKKEYYDGDIPFIRSGEISGDKTELFITDEGLNNSSAKMVKIGDILYALYGATSGEVSISKLKGAINQAILAIHPHEDYDSQFLMQWLRKSKENIIGTYLQGGQGNLSGNIVKQLLIDVPTYEEQKKIGAYFEHLDNLITLHQRKVEKLKEMKKGLLQQMFV